MTKTDLLKLGGSFEVTIIRKDGTTETFTVPNVVTIEGKKYILRAGITAEQSPSSTWYMGLIGANITPSANDKASTALGSSGTYQEITAYSPTARPQYSAAWSDSSSNINNDTSPSQFTFNASVTVYGVFIVNVSTKNSSSGVLFCAARFSSPRSVDANDVLQVKYSVSA